MSLLSGRTPEKPGHARGFTLIELTVALFIIGAITALTIPVFLGNMDSLKFRRAVQDVTSVMRYARSQAILKQRTNWVAFNLLEDRYFSGDGFDGKGPLLDDDGVKPYFLPRDILLGGFRWMDGSEEPKMGWVRFYPNGSSSGGSVIIAGANGKGVARIVMEPFTGLANIESNGSY